MTNVEGFQWTCEIPGCGYLVYKRGSCLQHYKDKNREHNKERGNWRKSKTWKRVRLLVLIRDDYQCQIKWRGCSGVAITADHIVPERDGGARFDMANLQAACEKCNSAKELKDRQARDYAAIDRRKYGSITNQ